jgi:hypothetical protein
MNPSIQAAIEKEMHRKRPTREGIIAAFVTFTYYFVAILATVIMSIEIAHLDSERHHEIAALFTVGVAAAFLLPVWMIIESYHWIIYYEVCFLGLVAYFCMHVDRNQLDVIAAAFLIISLGFLAPFAQFFIPLARYCTIAFFIWIAMMIFTAPACLSMETLTIVYHGHEMETNASHDKTQHESHCSYMRLDYLYSFITIIVVGTAGWCAFFALAKTEGWIQL